MPRASAPNIDIGSRVVFDGGLSVVVEAAIGRGSFGSVYRVVNADTGVPWAMKVEAAPAAALGGGGPVRRSQLEYEHAVYTQLSTSCGDGFPKAHGYTRDKKTGMRFLAMDLLGPNLQEVMEDTSGGRLPLKHVAIIATRVLDRLRSLHDCGLVHRDVKPQNFLMGGGAEKQSSVWCVDFGLVKCFRDADTREHIPFRDDKPGLTGTPRFASTFAQRGMESSRRDDLESLLFMSAYLYNGRLPWQRLPRQYDTSTPEGKLQRNAAILARKLATNHGDLYAGMPRFAELAEYVRGLGHDTKPNYAWIRDEIRATYRESARQQRQRAVPAAPVKQLTHASRAPIPVDAVRGTGGAP